MNILTSPSRALNLEDQGGLDRIMVGDVGPVHVRLCDGFVLRAAAESLEPDVVDDLVVGSVRCV